MAANTCLLGFDLELGIRCGRFCRYENCGFLDLAEAARAGEEEWVPWARRVLLYSFMRILIAKDKIIKRWK